MSRRLVRSVPLRAFFLLTALAISVAPALAQTGTITGRVTDAETGEPVAVVSVEVGGPSTVGGATSAEGEFRFTVAPGTYSVTVSRIGYETRRVDGVRIRQDEVETLEISLRSRTLILNPIVATVGRGVEQKAVDAPASVAVVHEEDIRIRPAPSGLEHLRNVPGLDIATHGLQSGNLVTRGFNNIFSGELHMLTDHRVAGIPSLRVNLMHLVPTTDEDIERMEVVLGPGSALYGPNTASGVLHVITKSPLQSQETAVSVAGGGQSLFHGTARTSHLIGDNLGIKFSTQYFRADEWEHLDPTEQQTREDILAADPGSDTRIGLRDFDLERWSGEIRADWRVDDQTLAVFQAGRTLSANAIELTGIGASQVRDWWNSYYQARVNRDRLFAQAYLNTSDAGRTYNLRDGESIIDESKLFVTQLQHGAAVGDRQDFTYGVDYIRTMPETGTTIHGRFEDEDTYSEIGAYLRSETALTDRFTFVGAARMDWHSELPDPVFSPRAALVFTPAEGQSIRATYNRAFSTPNSVNLFLDLNAGPFPGIPGMGIWAQGSAGRGFSFRNEDGSLTGMRSPFNPAGAHQLLPVDPQIMWGTAVGVLQFQGEINAQTADFLLGETPTGGEVGTAYLDLLAGGDPLPLTAEISFDIPPLKESRTTTWELGYKGLLGDRVLLATDVWYSRRENLVSDLQLVTPLLFLEGQSTAAHVGEALATHLVLEQGFSPEDAAAEAERIITEMASLPVGVLSSEDVGTVNERADFLLTIRNFGQVELWGTDLSAQILLDDRWRVNLAGSWVDRDHFVTEEGQRIALNAPTRKLSAAVQYRDNFRGWNGELRGRYNNGFPVLSGVHQGTACIEEDPTGALPCVDSFLLVDLSAGYRLPMVPGASIQLTVQNLFDEGYRSFIGAPEVGRLALLRLRYEF